MNARVYALLACAVGALAASAASKADVFEFNWVDNNPSVGHSDAGGVFSSVVGRYDSVTQRLDWSVTFANNVTQGLTLALNDGPNPKGIAGELGLVYIDATNPADIRATAYAYNGQNTYTSYRDGRGDQSGDQAPDRIVSSIINPSFLIDASVVDTATTRTISFSIDASLINNHAPLYPSANPSEPWTGIQFDDSMGIWLHSFRNLTTAYGNSGATNGYLTNWYRPDGKEGYFDGAFITTTLIPSPATGALAGLGVLGFSRRRRRAR